jgi:hypothetical protein
MTDACGILGHRAVPCGAPAVVAYFLPGTGTVMRICEEHRRPPRCAFVGPLTDEELLALEVHRL